MMLDMVYDNTTLHNKSSEHYKALALVLEDSLVNEMKKHLSVMEILKVKMKIILHFFSYEQFYENSSHF